MLVILAAKYVRIAMCTTVVKLLGTGREMLHVYFLNLVVDIAFFIVECTLTSRSLDTPLCVISAGLVFGGHPMIIYLNFLACVWDSSFILTHVMFLMHGF
jgi:hypothetical protein